MLVSHWRRACLALTLFATTPLHATEPAPATSTREEFPAPAGFTPGYATVEGVRTHYLKGGEGPLVLLVHGFPQTWYEWHQLMPVLAENHSVIAIDLPGLGLSGAPKSYVGQDIGEIIYKFAKRFSPDVPFDVVAHDVGIWNTYAMTARHQADVRRVVLADAPLPDEKLYTFPAFTPQGESLVWHFSFFNVKDGFAEKMSAGRERLLVEQNIRSHAARTDWLTPALLDLYGRSYAKPGVLHAAFEYYRALNINAGTNKELSATPLHMPVLVVAGGGHGGMGKFMGDQWRSYAANVSEVVLSGCGHWLPEECPAQFNQAVVDFLARR